MFSVNYIFLLNIIHFRNYSMFGVSSVGLSLFYRCSAKDNKSGPSLCNHDQYLRVRKSFLQDQEYGKPKIPITD